MRSEVFYVDENYTETSWNQISNLPIGSTEQIPIIILINIVVFCRYIHILYCSCYFGNTTGMKHLKNSTTFKNMFTIFILELYFFILRCDVLVVYIQ